MTKEEIVGVLSLVIASSLALLSLIGFAGMWYILEGNMSTETNNVFNLIFTLIFAGFMLYSAYLAYRKYNKNRGLPFYNIIFLAANALVQIFSAIITLVNNNTPQINVPLFVLSLVLMLFAMGSLFLNGIYLLKQ